MFHYHLKRSTQWLSFAFLVFASSAFAAELSPAERETARQLMDQGRDQDASQHFDAALVAYEAAHRIVNVPTTGLSVAKTLVKLNRLVEARDVALSAARMPTDNNEVFARANDEAAQLAEDLRRRIPVLIFRLPDDVSPKSVRISVDGHLLPPSTTLVSRAVNPGHHRIEVSSSTHKPLQLEVNVAPAEKRQVPLALDPMDANEAAVYASQVHASESRHDVLSSPQGRDAAGQGTSPWTYAGFGLAAAGIVVGAATGGLAYAKASGLRDDCGGSQCPVSMSGRADTIDTLCTVSDVSFAAALLGAGIGIYTLIAAPSHPLVHARATGRSAGIAWSF